MQRHIIKQNSRYLLNFFTRRNVQFEPPYLDDNKFEKPSYPFLNVQVKGYDYTILERYARWVHSTAVHMDIDVEECWATPCEKSEVVTYLKNTEVVENKYNLQMYERNVQIAELSSTMAPIFIQVIKAALPEGVKLSIHEHMEEHYNIRRIPDLQLKALESKLDELGGPVEKKK
ncbi:UNVERIFIED_CONTAM: hypothetical protein RMT77_016876 [Armadillidium vulgare]